VTRYGIIIWVIRMKTHEISKEEYEAAKALMKHNMHKRVDKRLQVIILRYEGLTDAEIGKKLGYARKWVSHLCAEFKRVGLEEYARLKYGGNHRAMSEEEERKILSEFAERAANGQVVTAWEIKLRFDEVRGKDTGRGYIYQLLERHKWRFVVPRSKHPKKASDEEIESSKKLT
jgi:transposase